MLTIPLEEGISTKNLYYPIFFLIAGITDIGPFIIIIIIIIFWPHGHGMQEFPGQGLNPHYSSDNTRS